MSAMSKPRLLSSAIYTGGSPATWAAKYNTHNWFPFELVRADTLRSRVSTDEIFRRYPESRGDYERAEYFLVDHENEVWLFGTLEFCQPYKDHLDFTYARKIMAQGTAAEGL